MTTHNSRLSNGKAGSLYRTDAVGRLQRFLGCLLGASYRRARRRSRPARLILKANGGRVVAGPFCGMEYVQDAIGSVWHAKLLGSYEKELWPVVREAVELQPDVVVNIGAAEGYYSVGMARLLPDCRVVSFEAETDYHYLLRDLAAVNGVAERVEIGGLCGPADLREALSAADNPLVICDVEGAEIDILDQVKVPSLRSAHVLLEVHDCVDPGISGEIRRRFCGTHSIRSIATEPRGAKDIPPGVSMPERWVEIVVAEGRQSEMEWFWMSPRTAVQKEAA